MDNEPSNSRSEFDVLGFGEAVLRYVPTKSCEPGHSPDSEVFFRRSVGGCELSLCVALAQLGYKAGWVSVLPEGPVGEVVAQKVLQKGVDMSWVGRTASGQVGIHHIFPEQHQEQYQRSNSTFAHLRPNAFDWASLVRCSRWLLLSGITPLLGDGPLTAWKAAIGHADKLSIPVCFDLNHQPILGTLDHLLYTIRPYLSKIKVLAVDSSTAAKLFQKLLPNEPPITPSEWHDIDASRLLQLRRLLQCNVLAVTCTSAADHNRQGRFSVVASSIGAVTNTLESQVDHRLVEDLGKSDVWLAGFMDVILAHGSKDALDDENTLKKAARQGDLLAALCQNSLGDFSGVTRTQLSSAMQALKWT